VLLILVSLLFFTRAASGWISFLFSIGYTTAFKQALRENGGWMADRMSDKVADRVNYGKLFLKRGGMMVEL